jgi:hypothetical protein
MLITKVQIFRPPYKRGEKRAQLPYFQQFHIPHLFLPIRRLFAGEKLSFGGSKLWFDGSKLSFGATKQNPFLPPTHSIASTVSILWMRRQQIFCFRP